MANEASAQGLRCFATWRTHPNSQLLGARNAQLGGLTPGAAHAEMHTYGYPEIRGRLSGCPKTKSMPLPLLRLLKPLVQELMKIKMTR